MVSRTCLKALNVFVVGECTSSSMNVGLHISFPGAYRRVTAALDIYTALGEIAGVWLMTVAWVETACCIVT